MSRRVPRIAKVCRHCQATFGITGAMLKHNAGIYCSKRCYWNARGLGSPEKFWAHTERRQPDGCWVWRGVPMQGSGYGRVVVAGRTKLAHRYAYELAHGPIAPGLVVMHSCDNPVCLRPEHLRLGTDAENNRDMATKGRGRYVGARLSSTSVSEIRAKHAAGGVTQSDLAAQYGVSVAAINALLRGRTWRASERPHAILSRETVTEARRRHAAGERCCQLARAMGVSYETMRHALVGLAWKHVAREVA